MVKIAFQTFRLGSASLKEIAMSLASNGCYYHCEIHFSDGSVGYAGNKKRGVVLINILDNLYDKQNWLCYKIPCDDEQEVKMKDYFIQNQNKKYGYFLVAMSMIAGLKVTKENSEFCSQICYNAMLSANVFPDYGFKDSELSPSNLQTLIQKLKWEIVKLQ